LEQSRKYTYKSLYKLMTSGGVRDIQMMTIWKCNIHLKVKIFIWMAIYDIIQSRVQLKRKKWFGPSDHILFQCPVAIYLWCFLRENLRWPKLPTSYSNFLVEIVNDCRGINKNINLFICTDAMWTIWKTRNDVVFNKKVITSPTTLIFKTLTLVKS
jgi:hypothetical protein